MLDENFLIVTTLLFQTYGPGMCPGTSTDETVVTNTFLDATDTAFTMWNEVVGTKTRMRGDLVISPTTIRLVRTECILDQAECDSDVTVLEVPR